MLKRLSDLIRFIRGDFIILKIDRNTLVVDAENFSKARVKEVASIFLKQVYDL